MIVSKELQNLIDKMIIQVKTNSELPLFMRRQIWDKINENSSDKQLVRKQLTELDCICVSRRYSSGTYFGNCPPNSCWPDR
jgi:ribosomal protein L17